MANEFKTRNGLIIPTETASTVPYLDANKKLVSSAVTPTTLTYLDATSSIQTQLDAKASSSSLTDHLNDTADAHDASAISNVAAGNLAATTVQAALDELQTDIDTRAPSNSPTLTTPSTDIITLDGQASTPANPSAGNYKVYVKDATQKLTVLDSTGAETTVGTGSGGGATPNYIASPDGTAIGDWATYDDGASSSPVDGTGGSPGATFAVSTSSTMRSTSNFLFTHDAADRQGEGFSYLMAIDPSDRGKVLRLSFDYLVASGTYADNGMAVWFYDVTNAALIQPAPYLIKNSSLIERFNCEVQVPSSCASLRVIFHVTTTTATAYTIRFDDFNFGPQAKLYGSPIADWSTSVTGSDTSNNSVVTYNWRRNGDTMEIDYSVSFSGAGDGGAYAVNLPTGYVIDTTKTRSRTLGHFLWNDSGTALKLGSVQYGNTTQLTFIIDVSGAVLDGSVFASGDTVSANVRVPIVGWSSSVVMSQDASTRVVSLSALRSGTPGAQTITAGAASEIIFDYINPNGDTHGGYSTTTGRYTAKVPGWYRYSSVLMINTGGTAPTYYNVYGQKNGTGSTFGLVYNSDTIANKSYGVSLSGKVFLNAGDYLSLWAYSVGQNITIATGQNTNTFELERISGPSQIAASETINARYTTTATTSQSNATFTILDFATKSFDSHNAVTTGASWKFTAPISGVYQVIASAGVTNGGGWAAGESIIGDIYKNGSSYERIFRQFAQTTHAQSMIDKGLTTVRLLAGEYIDFRFYQDSGAALNLNGSSQFIDISRVGNY